MVLKWSRSLSVKMFLPYVLTLECAVFCLIQGLTLDERNELFRKFKYYFASVRPNPAPNRIVNLNGTFFALRTELQLISTIPHHRQLNLEFIFVISFVDDRLVVRELEHRFKMPSEFRPWLPDLVVHPILPWKVTAYLDPRSGVVTAFYRIDSVLPCKSDEWRHPFEVFHCDIAIFSNGDEQIILQSVRDLRSNYQLRNVPFSSGNWPHLRLHFTFAHCWHSSLVSNLIPSLLVFSTVMVAQLQQRKIQVVVSLTALLCIVIMQSAHRSGTVVTLEDLWLSCTLLHVVCVLIVDLILPARSIQYVLFMEDACKNKFTGE
ncbi:hypothetical protein Tcan_14843 [Toxocara canis]|uniref:Uncharacterized protein n=1 Tax=Toxocara canis TaxID=6265 RepID=A0A0B2VM40_TOXCA|nr:hypothetical protein Tcan_14843 [Toxocara canis]